jgi:DNA-directed RNA polymerase specialized sigma24 family protein
MNNQCYYCKHIDPEVDPEDLPAPTPEPDLYDQYQQDLARLANALPTQHAVTLALLLAGRTYSDIARVRGCNRASARKHSLYVLRLASTIAQSGWCELLTLLPRESVVVQSYLHHITPQRAARALGVTRRAVRWGVSRRLQELLARSEPTEYEAQLLRVMLALKGLHLR